MPPIRSPTLPLCILLTIGLASGGPASAQGDAPFIPPPPADAPTRASTAIPGVTVTGHRPTTVSGVTVTAAGWCPKPDETRYPADHDPAVVDSFPAQGATSPAGWVPLSLTFDQPMSNCSFAYTPDFPFSFPQLSGQPPVIRNGRTLVLMVYLKPGAVYGVKLNDAQHPFFIGRSGLPAQPMELRFSTLR